jgi:UTP-glucose-1-phosphate uridylyltransferase
MLARSGPTDCVTGRWAGVDSAWEQEKLEARKMLEKPHRTHLSSALFVGQCYLFKQISSYLYFKKIQAIAKIKLHLNLSILQ